MKKKIEFTQDEAINLLALLNISLKTEGMNIAKTVVYFQDKFEQAFIVPGPTGPTGDKGETGIRVKENGVKKVKELAKA